MKRGGSVLLRLRFGLEQPGREAGSNPWLLGQARRSPQGRPISLRPFETAFVLG